MTNKLNYKDILSDFRKNFVDRVCIVTTNYKKLDEIKVLFKETQLPHLMGWHKITSGSATNIIKRVDNENFTYDNTKTHPEFFRIKGRLQNYDMLKDTFYDSNVKIMVVTRDMKPNRMRLDIVFMKNIKNEDIVLGLRKKKNSSYFVPTTLYRTNSNRNPFNKRKRTFIQSIYWEDTKD